MKIKKTLLDFVAGVSANLAILIVFIPVVLFIVYQLHPFAVSFSREPCGFLSTTGYDCVGCGGTRAVRYLLKGDVINSFVCNCFPLLLYTASVLYLVMINRYGGSDGRAVCAGWKLCLFVINAVFFQKLLKNYGVTVSCLSLGMAILPILAIIEECRGKRRTMPLIGCLTALGLVMLADSFLYGQPYEFATVLAMCIVNLIILVLAAPLALLYR